MILDILYNLFITPLEIVFNIVYSIGYTVFANAGIAILCLSIVFNFLVLPLYMRADKIQDEERQKRISMQKWVNHIKATFKGDERYMMINRYYRLENYKPVYAVKSSLSLLLQIPFFIAAYHYLSHLSLLDGASFLFLNDLGAPDAICQIGTFTINIMPIIMTLINVFSAIVYLKGAPLRDKLQAYAIAAVFLVLLYNSPSGLVLYWTFNQVFSLCKNVFIKYVKTKKTAAVFFICLGSAICLLTVIFGDQSAALIYTLAALSFFLCLIPLISYLKGKEDKKEKRTGKENSFSEIFKNLPGTLKPVSHITYLLGQVFLTLFLGLVIPLSVISASPAEFVSTTSGPAAIIAYTLSVWAGFLIVWCSVVYYMIRPEKRRIMIDIVFILSIIAVVNFYFFCKDMGTVSSTLVFDFYDVSTEEILFNSIFVMVVILGAILLEKILGKYISYAYIFLIALCAVTGFTGISQTVKTVDAITIKNVDADEKIISLSKNAQNVIVIMLDRGVNGYIPYMFDEKPELVEAFDGFTYYPNTVSYGKHTNYASPALYGGYEYTPVEMNKRDTETLESKHNEALKVLPVLFSENDYNVIVCDPPYAGYQEISDLSIYDEYDNISAYNLKGVYVDKYLSEFTSLANVQKKNFISYSLMKALPAVIQGTIYNNGCYIGSSYEPANLSNFLQNYSTLCAMKDITEIIDTDKGTFLIMDNETPHELTYLDPETYEPSFTAEIKSLVSAESKIVNNRLLSMDTDNDIQSYEVNMAAFLKIGEWLNYLKEQGVYDNTRIIIVADHGSDEISETQIEGTYLETVGDVQRYNPVLLVKDFNSTGELKTDNTFMTNADTPILATEDVVSSQTNVFTGNKLSDKKKAEDVVITTSSVYNVSINNGNEFIIDGEWWSVHTDIFNKQNWSKLSQ